MAYLQHGGFLFLISLLLQNEKEESRNEWKGMKIHYQQPLAPQNMLCFHDAQIMPCLISSTRWVTYMHTEMIQKWNRDDKMKIDDAQNELHTSTYLWCFLTFDLFILQNQTIIQVLLLKLVLYDVSHYNLCSFFNFLDIKKMLFFSSVYIHH